MVILTVWGQWNRVGDVCRSGNGDSQRLICTTGPLDGQLDLFISQTYVEKTRYDIKHINTVKFH